MLNFTNPERRGGAARSGTLVARAERQQRNSQRGATRRLNRPGISPTMLIVKPARIWTGVILLSLVLLPPQAWASQRFVTGTYRNPALGFSILVPPGLTGVAGDQAGPERGLRIPLNSGGEIVIFGEPNSLKWKTPAEGVRWELERSKCTLEQSEPEFSNVRVGKLNGARGRLACGGQVVTVLLAFHPNGGPIYWIRLDVPREHEPAAQAVLKSIAQNFKLIQRR